MSDSSHTSIRHGTATDGSVRPLQALSGWSACGKRTYAFAGNNPLNFTDPTGDFVQIIGGMGYGSMMMDSLQHWVDLNRCMGAAAAYQRWAGDMLRMGIETAAWAVVGGVTFRALGGAIRGGARPRSPCAGGRCGGKDVCFVAGTPVVTADGARSIEQVEVGDLVLSMDEETLEIGYRSVVRTSVTPDQQVLELVMESEDGAGSAIGVTPEHPFWVLGRGWLPAGDLLPGDELFTSTGGWLRIGGSTWVSEPSTVYNFEVEEFHTYFAGEAEVWVHNACPGADPFRRVPRTLRERLVMDEARGGAGAKIMDDLGDPRFKGMEKWQHVHRNPGGTMTVIHYVRDPATGQLMDFKFL